MRLNAARQKLAKETAEAQKAQETAERERAEAMAAAEEAEREIQEARAALKALDDQAAEKRRAATTIQSFMRGRLAQKGLWEARAAAGTIQARVRGRQLRRQLNAAQDKKLSAKIILVKHQLGEPARWEPGETELTLCSPQVAAALERMEKKQAEAKEAREKAVLEAAEAEAAELAASQEWMDVQVRIKLVVEYISARC